MKLRYTQMALAAALLAVQMVPSVSWAQMSPADAERLLRMEQERLRGEQERSTRERAPSGVDLRTLVPKPEQVTSGGICHDIRSIDLKGADLLDEQDKQGEDQSGHRGFSHDRGLSEGGAAQRGSRQR